MKREKIQVVAHGDSSVGIPDEIIYVEMFVDDRELVRENLKECFGNIWDTVDVTVTFEDEMSNL